MLVISCGPGYFVNMLAEEGYCNVVGIDSFEDKVVHAQRRGLRCERAGAHEYLSERPAQFDAIVCEQELNHLTKDEMIEFLCLAQSSLRPGGTLIVHGLNGANPITPLPKPCVHGRIGSRACPKRCGLCSPRRYFLISSRCSHPGEVQITPAIDSGSMTHP